MGLSGYVAVSEAEGEGIWIIFQCGAPGSPVQSGHVKLEDWCYLNPDAAVMILVCIVSH